MPPREQCLDELHRFDRDFLQGGRLESFDSSLCYLLMFSRDSTVTVGNLLGGCCPGGKFCCLAGADPRSRLLCFLVSKYLQVLYHKTDSLLSTWEQ